LASGEWLVRLSPHEAIAVHGAIVREVPDDDVIAMLKWNHCHFDQPAGQ
jgi:hypothetical protein